MNWKICSFRKTWFEAKLNGINQGATRAWAWTLWSYEIPFGQLPKEPFTIICRAMDTHSNSQPDTARGIWNIRGLMNNAWHKIDVQLDRDYLKK